MRVVLGDGREVECQSGITRLPPGPMPDVLNSEVVRAEVVSAQDVHASDLSTEERYRRRAPVAVMARGFNRDDERRPEPRPSPERTMARAMFETA